MGRRGRERRGRRMERIYLRDKRGEVDKCRRRGRRRKRLSKKGESTWKKRKRRKVIW